MIYKIPETGYKTVREFSKAINNLSTVAKQAACVTYQDHPVIGAYAIVMLDSIEDQIERNEILDSKLLD